MERPQRPHKRQFKVDREQTWVPSSYRAAGLKDEIDGGRCVRLRDLRLGTPSNLLCGLCGFRLSQTQDLRKDGRKDRKKEFETGLLQSEVDVC